ncbi:hypothetical protein [Capnocytophaga sputigena]|uniref:hypothetical protein n=1 Tax=Capnocytophaga sputigena TaxID=1019 RepID=UPI00288B50BE|nr:hypothetical protein [Capnocytophaga sputigena]
MKTFYLYTLLLLSLGCKAQEFDLRNMKRFDEKVFKDWEVDTSILNCNPATTYLKKGDKRAQIIMDENFKQVRISDTNTPYEQVFQYYIKTGILRKGTTLFYGMSIGKTYTYNEKGKLIKEENWDAPYKVSVEELITICKQKLNLDLMDISLDLTIHRYDKENPIYIIRIPDPDTMTGIEAKYITISADNGEILLEKEIHSKEEFKKSIEEIYNPSLNKK